MRTDGRGKQIVKNIFDLLDGRHKRRFLWIAVILAVSAALSQLTPLAVGYLTDHVLSGGRADFLSVVPILLVILVVNVAGEVIKVARRLMVEDTATQAEKSARGRAADSLLRAREMRHHKAMALYDCLKFVNEAFFSVLVIGLSVLLAANGVITVGTVLTAYLCFTQLTGPLRELHRILDEFSECVVLADDYFRMVELPLDFSYQVPLAGSDARPLSNDVQVCGVRFCYPEKPDRPILRDVSLTIPAGQFIGIAGPSGCGKSSLIKVLDKLEQATGAVRIGGAHFPEKAARAHPRRGDLGARQHLGKACAGRDRAHDARLRHDGHLDRAPADHAAQLRRDPRHAGRAHRAARHLRRTIPNARRFPRHGAGRAQIKKRCSKRCTVFCCSKSFTR